MVEIFRTNVSHPLQANFVANAIVRSFEGCKVNFDLDDCDRILRVEAEALESEAIIGLVSELGVRIEVLPDVVEMIELQFT